MASQQEKEPKIVEAQESSDDEEEVAAADASGQQADAQKKKKKKKKKKTKTAGSAEEASTAASSTTSSTASKPQGKATAPTTAAASTTSAAAPSAEAILALVNSALGRLSVEKKEPEKKGHAFWDHQPVPKLDAPKDAVEGPIEPDKTNIRQTPLNLPEGFVWSDIDIDDAAQLDELYTLLNENYVEDSDAMFRFDYSKDFLKWALQPPGFLKLWHVGVRYAKNNKLYAFISAIPATIRVNAHAQKMVEINFLCAHKKIRSKRLAPVLISEITRRVHLQGIFQATYTAGAVLPRPVSRCRYWHRALNPKKLVEVEFSSTGRNTLAQYIAKNHLAQRTTTPGLRPAEPKDAHAIHKLVTRYLEKFALAPVFDEEEIVHWLLPREGVLSSYVVENPETKEITDFVSFYWLPSTVTRHPTHKKLYIVYSYYNVATSTELQLLMNDALILGKQAGADVFNALDLMDNELFLEQLGFGRGDGNLNYYLYNYNMNPVEPPRMGLVLL